MGYRAGNTMKFWPLCVFSWVVIGCGAVFPEVVPLLRPPPAGQELEPAPPDDLVFVAFAGAQIPPRTRDGRKWDSMGGEAPDVFAKLFVDDKEIIRTPIESDTLKPTWPDQQRANYRISSRAKVRVELWDSNPINNQPICIKRLHNLPGQSGPVAVDVECDSGATLRLRVEPAHARWGLGFAYELLTVGAAVTRVIGSPPPRLMSVPGVFGTIVTTGALACGPPK
jgi:hypothetical protein